MESRKIASLDVSVVGLGCNNFGMRINAKETKQVVDAAIDAGITLLDTADIYGGRGKSEEFLGKALGKRKRDKVVVATKFGAPMSDDGQSGGASARWINQAVEDSLRRLNTDRIDLYQLHFPDGNTPIEETIEAMDGLVKAGKVRAIGNSNFSGELLDAADAASKKNGWTQFASAQNEWSLLKRGVEADVIPACARLGLGMLPYFPLASGMLTGKYRRGEDPAEGTRLANFPAGYRDQFLNDEAFERVEKLQAFAAEHGHTLLELAMSWMACQPTVASVIAGATSAEQVVANVAAAEWKLSDEELQAVDELAPKS